MLEVRINLTDLLSAQLKITKNKHRAAEMAGREIWPEVLDSAETTTDFFNDFDNLEEPFLRVIDKMAGPQLVRRTLHEIPPNETLEVLSHIAEEEGLKAEIAGGLLEGVALKAKDKGKRVVPQILSSHTALRNFFEETEASGGLSQPLAERMFSPEVFAASLQQAPTPEVIAVLVDELGNSEGARANMAMAIIEGLFGYPYWLFEQKAKDRYQARVNLEQVTRTSIDLLCNYAWAVALTPSHFSVEKALEFYGRHIMNSQGLSVFDFLGGMYYLPEDEIEQRLPQAAAATILMELHMDRFMGREENLSRLKELMLHDTRIASELRRFSIDGQIRERVEAMSLEVLKRVEESRSYLKAAVKEATGEIKTFFTRSQKEPLLNEAIRLRLETLAEEMLGERAEFFIIDQPGGFKHFVSYNRFQDETVAGEAMELAREALRYALKKEAVWERNTLSSREMEAVIRLLGPEFSTEQLDQFLQENYEALLKTSVSIPESGREVPLRLEEEKWLRDMGLQRMLFRPSGDGGFLIMFDFGNYSYPVVLNKDLLLTEAKQAAFPEMLGNLSENSRLHLLAIVYSYLDSLLHPKRGGEEILGVRKRGEKKEPEIMTIGETRDYLGGTTYLRVLPLGQRCHQLENREANQRVKDRFGHSLDEIWATFLAAQEDRQTLEALRGSAPRLWGTVTRLLDENLISKDDKVEWVEDGGKMVMRVKGASKVLGKRSRQLEAAAAKLLGVSVSEFPEQEKTRQDLYDYPGGICYEVTAALCEESLERKSVVCPQAAARLKKLAEV